MLEEEREREWGLAVFRGSGLSSLGADLRLVEKANEVAAGREKSGPRMLSGLTGWLWKEAGERPGDGRGDEEARRRLAPREEMKAGESQ